MRGGSTWNARGAGGSERETPGEKGGNPRARGVPSHGFGGLFPLARWDLGGLGGWVGLAATVNETECAAIIPF
jgi:hypothetical protein